MGILNYVKTVWQDRVVSTPNLYTKSGETSTEVTLIAKPTTVTQAGTAINATNLNNLENGVAGALQTGTVNTDMDTITSMLIETDTRGVFITRDVSGKITSLQERDSDNVTVIRTNTLGRNAQGFVTSVTQVAGGKTVTYTLNRNVTDVTKVDSITKTVV